MSDTNRSPWERYTTDNMSTVSAGVPVILLSGQDPSRSLRIKVEAQRPQTNYRLNEGFSHVYHRLFHPFREQQLSKNIFSVDKDFSP